MKRVICLCIATTLTIQSAIRTGHLDAFDGTFRFPGMYPDLEYSNALPVSQQGRRELYDRRQQDDGKVRTFADIVEEAQEKQADSAAALVGPDRQLMTQQQEKRDVDDDWARLCLSKLHSKNIALEEAREARLQAEKAKKSLESMRERQEQLIAERNELAELARRHEEAAARAAAAERDLEAARRAAGRSSNAPSRSNTLAVEAASEGAPRRGPSMLGRSRTVSLSRASLSQADIKDEGPSRGADHMVKTVHESFEMIPPKRLHIAIPQQGRRKGEILNSGEE